MFRESGFKPKTKTINIIFMDGGLGDHVAALTAVKYIHTNYTWIKPLLWVPDYVRDFARNVLPSDLHNDIKGYSQMQGVYDPSRPTKTTKWDGIISPMKTHLVDYAFLKLCDEAPSIEHKNYCRLDLTKLTLGEILNFETKFTFKNSKFVVITTGYTAAVREFPAKSINEIVKYLKHKEITPVFLGQSQTKTGGSHQIKGNFSEEIDFSQGINLIDKTTLVEAAGIMHLSAAVVGVDNGLMHVAGCTDAPIVGGFTTVNPEVRWPIRNGVLGLNCYPVLPDKSLDCSFCQVKSNFLYGHDYRDCMYKDRLCVSQMTAQKFINHLETILL